MRAEYKVIIAILVIGGLIAILTAQPDVGFNVKEKSVETRSDIFFTYTTVRYPSKVELIELDSNATNFSIGVNTETDKLDFGVVIGHGGSVKRLVNLTTVDGKSSRMHVRAHGDIAPLLNIERTDFVFNGRATVAVTFVAGDWPPGNYTGEVDVVIQRSNNDIIRYLIGY